MNFIKNLSTLIFDLDGTVWRSHILMEGVADSLNALRASGIHCLFCTNSSGMAPAVFIRHMENGGVPAIEDEYINAAMTTAMYLEREFGRGATVYCIGRDSLKAMLVNAGATLLDEAQAAEVDAVDAVIVGNDRLFNYEKMRLAQNFVRNGARFIAVNNDTTVPVIGGFNPGAGSIVAAIATGAGREPIVIGKPHPFMLELYLKKFQLDPHRTALVGDRLDTDIPCGHRAGIHSILVTTGVHSHADAQIATGEARPDAVFADISTLCREILN